LRGWQGKSRRAPFHRLQLGEVFLRLRVIRFKPDGFFKLALGRIVLSLFRQQYAVI